jgi:flagella basal body P-ring formation protein FlgA
VLSNQQLVASKAVLRGQTVTLVADAGGIMVRMAGRALTDGLVNQRVRVQNLSSGKIVEGIARSEQVVEIIFQ